MKFDRTHMIIGMSCLMIGILIGTMATNPKGIPFVGKKRHKAIGLYTGKTPFSVSPAHKVSSPILSAHDVNDVQAEYVTDPFVVKKGAIWFMFFGVRKSTSKLGAIGLATSPDGFNWEYQRIVLNEPFHTSYPYIVNWKDEFYMIPDSTGSDTVRLYKAHDFPNEWKLVKTLLNGNFVDPTLFRSQDMWWMFAESNPNGNDRLSLFFAEDLEGPWMEHPMSPIVNGNGHIARPGGRVLNFDNRLIRFTQDDEPSYGNKLWAFEITHLSKTDYQEKQVGNIPVLKEGNMSWNNLGMHHIDLHQDAPDLWLAFVSGHGDSWVFGTEH